MYEYLMSLPPEDLVSAFMGLCFCFCYFVGFAFIYAVKDGLAWWYCRRRQKKPQTTRCLFANSCPTFDNCPYNVNSRRRQYRGFKEWFRQFSKKKKDGADDES